MEVFGETSTHGEATFLTATTTPFEVTALTSLSTPPPVQTRKSLGLGLRRACASLLSASPLPPVASFVSVLEAGASAGNAEMVDPPSVFAALNDVLSGLTVPAASGVFAWLESKPGMAAVSPLLASRAGSLGLLKACNDLLSRLSMGVDNSFRGRILMFMASVFPLSDRSGVNLASHVNSDTSALLDTALDGGNDGEEKKGNGVAMEVGDAKNNSGRQLKDRVEEGAARGPEDGPVDFAFYRSFWSLQDAFKDPGSLVGLGGPTRAWADFVDKAELVLKAFATQPFHQMDDAVYKGKGKGKGVAEMDVEGGEEGEDAGEGEVVFCNYLTSSRLIQLELSDPFFRRHILLQMLILFQALEGGATKAKARTLSHEQGNQVEALRAQVLREIRGTPPDGPAFAKVITKLLKRENAWVQWKVASCPPFEREANAGAILEPVQMGKRKRVGEEMAAAAKLREQSSRKRKRRLPGMPAPPDAVTQVSNLLGSQDNWTPLKEAVPAPSMDSVMRPLVDDEDPDWGIEEAYKRKNDAKYMWKALRVASSAASLDLYSALALDVDSAISVHGSSAESSGVQAVLDAPLWPHKKIAEDEARAQAEAAALAATAKPSSEDAQPSASEDAQPSASEDAQPIASEDVLDPEDDGVLDQVHDMDVVSNGPNDPQDPNDPSDDAVLDQDDDAVPDPQDE